MASSGEAYTVMAHILVQQENRKSDSASLSAIGHMWTATGQQMRWQNFIPSWKTRNSYIGLHHLADSQHSHPQHTEQKQGFVKGQNWLTGASQEVLWSGTLSSQDADNQKSKLYFNCIKPHNNLYKPLGSSCSTILQIVRI